MNDDQEITSLRQQIKEQSAILTALQERLAAKLAQKAQEEEKRQKSYFAMEVASWNSAFKKVTYFAFVPLVVITIIVAISSKDPSFLLRVIGLYCLTAVAFYSGHYVAYGSKNGVLGFIVGAAIFNAPLILYAIMPK